MAKKGGNKKRKRLNASKAIKIERKKATWIIKSKAGTHNARLSAPLGVILRDYLKIASNLKEVKAVLNKGNVLVDGIQRKKYSFNIGLFDVIDLPLLKKRYRVIVDHKGRIDSKEIAVKKTVEKICKVVGKHAAAKGLIQLAFHDGSTLLQKKTSLKNGDSALIQLPERKIVKEFGLEKGKTVFISGGTHASEIAVIEDIIPGTMKRAKLLNLKKEKKEFQTIENNVFVIGEKETAIDLGA